MFLRIKCILMNKIDDPAGGGGAPNPAPPIAPPANQGAAPLTREDLQAFAKTTHDGIFAELRRTGVLRDGKPKTKEKAPEGDPPESTLTAPAAPDPIKMRGLDRVVTRLGYATQLNETSYQRLERAFIEDQPADPEAWVKDYFAGFGVAQPTTNKPADPSAAGTTQQKAAPGQPAGDPITSRGAPATGKVPVEDLNLWTASDADREAYIRAKGIRGYTAKLREQGKGIRIKTRD